jgi:phosphoglycerol transferase MdoB-like AlkP superfamily enzyme
MKSSNDLPVAAPDSRGVISLARYAPVGVLGAVVFVLSFVTRALLIAVHGGWPAGRWPALARAFAVGAIYDAAVTLWLLLPLTLYLTLATSSWLARRLNRALLFATVAIATAGALFVAVAELVFFGEFDGRFNFVAVDYLIYPTEVVNNIWESYPTGWMLAGVALVAAAVVYVSRRPLRNAIDAVAPLRARFGIALAYVVVLLAFSSLARPSLAHVSDDRALNEVASNGYYAFWEAFEGQGTSYAALYAKRPRRFRGSAASSPMPRRPRPRSRRGRRSATLRGLVRSAGSTSSWCSRRASARSSLARFIPTVEGT